MRFKITLPGRSSPEEIEADYFRIDFGHLIFRNNRADRHSYPETLKAFAPGAWLVVEKVHDQEADQSKA